MLAHFLFGPINSDLGGFGWGCVLGYHLFYRRFRPLKDQYKLPRVEKKFMNALIKDVEYVSDLGRKIDKKAHQLWDSQLRPGATEQLSDVEKEWVSAIEAVVRKAKSCCQNYQRLSQRRQFPRWVYSVFMDFRKIRGLHTEIDSVNDEMYDNLFRKCYEIYRSLEGSRLDACWTDH